MRRPTTRVIVGSTFAGLALVAVGVTASSWFGGHDTGDARSNAALHAGAAEPATLPAATETAVRPIWLRPDRGTEIQTVSANQEIRTTRQPAHIEPYERTAIYAKVAGFVSSVRVDLGSHVKKGDVLAELWIPEMEQDLLQKKARVEEAAAAVGQAEAAITAASAASAAAASRVVESRSAIEQYVADVELRQSERARIAELVQRGALQQALLDEKHKQLASAKAAHAAAEAGVVSAQASERVEQAHVMQARANLVLAQSRLKVAEADLKQTEVLMAYAVIRAPYEGVVTERLIDTGDFARSPANGAPEPLFTFMRESPLRIVVDIPESDAGWVRTGLPATLSVDGIKDYQCACVVRRTAEMLDPKMHTLRIELEITDHIKGLRPGMYGSVTITSEPATRSASSGNPASASAASN